MIYIVSKDYVRRISVGNETEVKRNYDNEELQRIRLEVQTMCLSDNELFLTLMRDPRLFSHVLSVVIGNRMETIGEIKVVSTNHQIRFSANGNHSVYLDAYATDNNGNVCHIEMENVPSRMPVKRVRYYCAASDISSLKAGLSYDKLPMSIHIVFTKGDVIGNGKAVTFVTRITDDGKEYGDESFIYHVNMLALASGELGMLIRSMLEPDPAKIEDEVVKDVVKSAKGDERTVRSIYEIKDVLSIQEKDAYFNAGKIEGIAEGKAVGRAEGERDIILKAINEGRSKSEISSFLNISLDEIDSILDSNIND